MRTLFGLGLLAVGWLMGWQLFAPERLPSENLVQLRKQLLAMPAPGDNPELRLAFVPETLPAGQAAPATSDRRAQASGHSTHARNVNVRIEVAGIATDAPAPSTQISAASQAEPTLSPSPAGTPTPSGDGLARELAQRGLWSSIQNELKRVGCYNGAADGVWGEESRQALLRFAAVNGASLDPRRPDVSSLALLRSQSGTTCTNFDRRMKTRIAGSSSGAPTGSSSESGLVAGPVLARTGSGLAPLEGRMAVGGPPLEHIEARAARSPFESEDSRRPTPPDYVATPYQTTPGSHQQFGALPHDSMVAPVQPEAAEAAAIQSERKRRASKKRRSKEARQRALMRQAFGDNF